MYINGVSSIVIVLLELLDVEGYFFNRPYPTYPTLYRHYVIRNLSAMGKELFYAPAIHPSCAKKKGSCIKRKLCKMQVLYISRVCYKKDLVCCYDNRERFPSVRYVTKKKPPVKITTTKPPEDVEAGDTTPGGGNAAPAGNDPTTGAGDAPPPDGGGEGGGEDGG